jgi:hypothetical protein
MFIFVALTLLIFWSAVVNIRKGPIFLSHLVSMGHQWLLQEKTILRMFGIACILPDSALMGFTCHQ